MKGEILHILPTLGKGGGARVVIDLCNSAIENGYDVELLIVQDSPLQNEGVLDTIDKKVRVRFAININADVPYTSSLKGSFMKVYVWLLFVKWVFCNQTFVKKFDIIHVHMPAAVIAGNVIWILKKIYGWTLRVYETVHSDSKSLKRSTFSLFSFSWRFRNGVIFEIRKEDLDIYHQLYPNGNAIFIPLGVKPISNIEHNINRKKLYSKLNIEEGSVVIAQVGRLNIQDRRTDKYSILFKTILDRYVGNQNLVFILFGDGPDRRFIEKQIDELGLNTKIFIYGFVNNLAEVFSIIDIYITLNIREDCGIAGLQAISYGLPTLALQGDETHLGGEYDWIPSSQSINTLADMIIANIQDNVARKKLAESQKRYFDTNISYQKMGQDTLKFYNK